MKNLKSPSGEVLISARPEEFFITDEENSLKGTIKHSVFLGMNTHYFIQLENGKEIEIVERSTEDIHKAGSKISLTLDASKINLFDKDGSKNLLWEAAI
jgi:iron(III) transport system ATP-binding protein